MQGTRWVGFADERARSEVEETLHAAGYSGDVAFLESPEKLRSSVALDGRGMANVVVGPVSEGVSDINLAAAIASDRQANQVVLVRRGASGSLRSRAHRAGVSDVLDPQELTLVREGAGETNRADGGPTDASAPSAELVPATPVSIASHPERVRSQGAPVLVLCSGRGGSGTSAITVAAAAIAASWGMRVGLVDLDLACGNAYSYLGLPTGFDLSTLSVGEEGAELPRGVLSGELIRVWGPCDAPETAELAMPHAGALVSAAASACDLVLVDTSTTFTDAVAQAAQVCDRLALVSDDRPGALAALSRMAGLAVRLGVARTRIVRISNREDPRSRAEPVQGRANVGLETARAFRVFESEELDDVLASGEASSLPAHESAFVESVAYFLASVLSEMGRLPKCKEAQQALRFDGSRQGWGIFGRKREVG